MHEEYSWFFTVFASGKKMRNLDFCCYCLIGSFYISIFSCFFGRVLRQCTAAYSQQLQWSCLCNSWDSAYGHEESVAINSVPVPLVVTVKKQKSKSLLRVHTTVTSVILGSIDTQLKQFQKDFDFFSILKCAFSLKLHFQSYMQN